MRRSHIQVTTFHRWDAAVFIVVAKRTSAGVARLLPGCLLLDVQCAATRLACTACAQSNFWPALLNVISVSSAFSARVFAHGRATAEYHLLRPAAALQMLDLGERLIKAGVLYADDTPVEKMREERMDGIESKRRNRSVDENLAMFKEMQAGTEAGLKNCLRFKLDMQAGNKALRDPVAFRCNLTSHWRTGDKYKVCHVAYAGSSFTAVGVLA